MLRRLQVWLEKLGENFKTDFIAVFKRTAGFHWCTITLRQFVRRLLNIEEIMNEKAYGIIEALK